MRTAEDPVSEEDVIYILLNRTVVGILSKLRRPLVKSKDGFLTLLKLRVSTVDIEVAPLTLRNSSKLLFSTVTLPRLT